MWPHRRKPTRLPRPWDSPGKNAGVGCHFLLQCMKVKSEREVAQSCLTLSDPMDCSLPGSSIHGIFQARVLEWDAIALPSRLIQSPCLSFLSHVANSHCWSPLSEVCRCLDYCWWIFLLASLFINFIRYERRRLCLASFCYVYSEAMTYFTFICSYTLADYFEILKC